MQRYELYFWHCRVLSIFVGFCQFLSVFSSTNICIIHKKSLTLQRLIILYKKVKMQTTSAPMAWLFLPENEQVQYLQKIAQCAKNTIRPQMVSLSGLALFSARSAIFCRYWTCTFSCRNNQAIGPRLSAIFTLLFIHISFTK